MVRTSGKRNGIQILKADKMCVKYTMCKFNGNVKHVIMKCSEYETERKEFKGIASPVESGRDTRENELCGVSTHFPLFSPQF